jgi:hypothetical protein
MISCLQVPAVGFNTFIKTTCGIKPHKGYILKMKVGLALTWTASRVCVHLLFAAWKNEKMGCT